MWDNCSAVDSSSVLVTSSSVLVTSSSVPVTSSSARAWLNSVSVPKKAIGYREKNA